MFENEHIVAGLEKLKKGDYAGSVNEFLEAEKVVYEPELMSGNQVQNHMKIKKLLIEAYTKNGDFDNALTECDIVEEVYEKQPYDSAERAAIRMTKGDVLFKAGEYNKALKQYNLAEQVTYDPKTVAEISIHKAEKLFELGKNDQAFACYDTYQIQQINERIGENAAIKANIYMEKAKKLKLHGKDGAYQECEKAIKLDRNPNSIGKAYLTMGEFFIEDGEMAKAEEMRVKAKEYIFDSYELAMYEGFLKSKTNQPSGALVYYTDAIKKARNVDEKAEAYKLRGDVQCLIGKKAQGFKDYQKAIETFAYVDENDQLQLQNSSFVCKIAESYLKQGEDDKAIESYDNAIAAANIPSEKVNAGVKKADILFKQGKHYDAVTQYKFATQQNVHALEKAKLYSLLGDRCFEATFYEESAGAYQTAQKLDPDTANIGEKINTANLGLKTKELLHLLRVDELPMEREKVGEEERIEDVNLVNEIDFSTLNTEIKGIDGKPCKITTIKNISYTPDMKVLVEAEKNGEVLDEKAMRERMSRQ